MPNQVYALVDCNNFFVSCEQVFNPSLRHKPVIVLSSNDGCCVSRSNEAKALGIPMGIPFFELKSVIKKHEVQVFSSNFELYADMSQRVMKILTTYSPTIEFYSIDEAFLEWNTTDKNYQQLGTTIRQDIFQQTGITVSVGVGQTKTLAKAASELAKKHPEHQGVFDFTVLNTTERLRHLNLISVADIWGIGRHSAPKLQALGMYSAADLAQASPQLIKQITSIHGMRTATELQGTVCLQLNDHPDAKKGICSSRSFGRAITEISALQESIASHIDHGCAKLRREGSVAQFLTIFVKTRSVGDKPKYHARSLSLTTASSYPPDFTTHIPQTLKQLTHQNARYIKTGILLTGISPATSLQQHLFETQTTQSLNQHQAIQGTMDALRQRYGVQSVQFATALPTSNWQTRCERRSQRFTTRLPELIVAN